MSAASAMGKMHQAWAVACQTGLGQVEQGRGASNGPERIASGQGASKVGGVCPGWSSHVHRDVAGAGAHGGCVGLVGGPGNVDGGVGRVGDAWDASNGARRHGTGLGALPRWVGGMPKWQGVSRGGRRAMGRGLGAGRVIGMWDMLGASACVWGGLTARPRGTGRIWTGQGLCNKVWVEWGHLVWLRCIGVGWGT